MLRHKSFPQDNDYRYYESSPAGGACTRGALATVPTPEKDTGLGLRPKPNHCQGFQHPKTQTIAFGPVLPPYTRHLNLTNLPRIKFLSSDCIIT